MPLFLLPHEESIMQAVQLEIAKELKVQAPFANQGELEAEVTRRIQFIKDCLHNARLKVLVLGISGGVDSLTAGLMAQRAVRELRESTGDDAYQFIAVRLPYHIQHDEHEATASVDFINPDERHTVDIAPSVKALVEQVKAFEGQPDAAVDFVKGNVKARTRMVAQYTIAGVRGGLVIGTDHAAEAVMGFFTKFGDGACDLAPLSGLVKNQVRAIARNFGAPENLVEKIPTADLEDLVPGKPDEASHGVTYAEIDAFLHGEPLRQEAFDIIANTYRKTQHKRDLPYAP
jgi:NAD+ synthase